MCLCVAGLVVGRAPSRLRAAWLETRLGAANLRRLDDAAAALGYDRRALRPQGNKPMITYVLHLGCETAAVTALNPTFWASPVVEARLVFHNVGAGDFFSWKKGLVMTEVNEYPGDSKSYEVTTDVPNWEYGFALRNQAGEIVYEIGVGGGKARANRRPVAPLFHQKECTNSYGGFHNRMAPIDVLRAPSPGFVDTVFGACASDCRPAGDYWSWSVADKQRMTEVMKTNPPTGLGAKFTMFGVNADGVCTMNIHNQNGNYDDIMLHYDARPKQGKSIIDFKTAGSWAGDYSGWRTQLWPTTYVGPTAENDPNIKWWYTYEYTNTGLRVSLNGNTLFTAPWRSAGAYKHVSYIDLGWQTNDHIKSTPGVCYLTPEAPPRAPQTRILL
jgi:hypothetical protein